MLNAFHFKRTPDGSFLLTNDFGRYAFLTPQEFRGLLTGSLDKEGELYGKLCQDGFLMEPFQIYDPEVAARIRDMKSYVFSATTLHIFVVTNACNLRCAYCQAQSDPNHAEGMMSEETARRAVDIALQSPAKRLTFEFQGGEPLRNFPIIRFIVEYAESVRGNKGISFTVVSNLSLLNDEILDFLIEHHVSVSTSLDGPQVPHDRNRAFVNGQGSYRAVMAGLERIRARGASAGAIQTTTRASLAFPSEIVREYQRDGIPGIFLRPLTPLGFAKSEWEKIGYAPEEFLQFYRTAFDEILTVNREGAFFPEQHAVYFLKKILGGYAVNYMELRSPCGAGIGQLAYYYNGDIYACDEARMVAEAGDAAFRLGNVHTADYASLMSAPACKAARSSSILEGIPGCCDCVYQPYCGVCPVVNYAARGDLYAKTAGEYRCKIYAGMLDFLFSLIRQGNPEVTDTLYGWIQERS